MILFGKTRAMRTITSPASTARKNESYGLSLMNCRTDIFRQ